MTENVGNALKSVSHEALLELGGITNFDYVGQTLLPRD
jgi:hypothetical protein